MFSVGIERDQWHEISWDKNAFFCVLTSNAIMQLFFVVAGSALVTLIMKNICIFVQLRVFSFEKKANTKRVVLYRITPKSLPIYWRYVIEIP